MVHRHGPHCADTTAAAGQESAAGQGFLIGDASLVRTPGSPAKAKLPGLQRNSKNSGRTKWGNRLASRYQSVPSIFNELRACSDFPRHMMGTWATLRRLSPKHALFTP